jgi:small subunit ribosomal protein S6
MPIYETVCILHPELSEARVKDVIEGMQKTLEQGQASLLQVEEWGMRNLAYDIQKQRRGYYVRLEYESPPQAVKDFERGLRLSEDTMRFLSVARSAPSDGQSPIPPGGVTDRSTGHPPEASPEPMPAEAHPAPSAPAEENTESAQSEVLAEAPAEAPPAEPGSTETAEAQPDSEGEANEE